MKGTKEKTDWCCSCRPHHRAD